MSSYHKCEPACPRPTNVPTTSNTAATESLRPQNSLPICTATVRGMPLPSADPNVSLLLIGFTIGQAQAQYSLGAMLGGGVHWGPVLTDGVLISGDSANLCARVAASTRVGEIGLTREAFQTLAPQHQLACRPLGTRTAFTSAGCRPAPPRWMAN